MSNLLAPISDSCISFATNNIWDKFGQVSEGNEKTQRVEDSNRQLPSVTANYAPLFLEI